MKRSLSGAFRSTRHAQAGSFIIESMVSLGIFAVALVGILGLVASALNQLNQSKSRNDASYVAGELIADMWVASRINIDQWSTRLGTLIPGATGNVYFSSCDCLEANMASAAFCSPAALKTGMQNVPSSQAVTVCISWNDKKEAAGAVPRRYQTSTVISRN